MFFLRYTSYYYIVHIKVNIFAYTTPKSLNLTKKNKTHVK